MLNNINNMAVIRAVNICYQVLPVAKIGFPTTFYNFFLSLLPACLTTGVSHSVITAAEMGCEPIITANQYPSVPISSTYLLNQLYTERCVFLKLQQV